MRPVVRGSSRFAYLFVSLNLILLLIFFVSTSVNVRQVDTSRDRYERLVREWFSLRLIMAERPAPVAAPAAYFEFAESLELLLESELVSVATRLSEPLATSAYALSSAWEQLHPVLEDRVFSISRLAQPYPPEVDYLVEAFEGSLLGFEAVFDQFVSLQQRAVQILNYFLGGSILAMIGIFLLVERETEQDRRAAVQMQSLAQSTIGAQEQERARISRALHDSLAQELSVALLEIGELEADGSSERAAQIRRRIRGVVDWVRHLAHELHPAEIEEVGLARAVASYCADLASASSIRIDWSISDELCDVPREVAINVYRITQEAVTNALRHSAARRIAVGLAVEAESLVLTVSDDGRGFRRDSSGHPIGKAGIGLIGMHERANMLGAELDVETGTSKGTSVRLSVPLAYLGCMDEDRHEERAHG